MPSTPELLRLALTASFALTIGCQPGRLFSYGGEIELIDSGTPFDGGPAFDGGPMFDAGPPFDGGVAFDGGMDSGQDAGNDSGVPPAGELAPVTISNVDVFQTVEVPIARGGSAEGASVPIVAGREAWMRVAVTPDGGFSGTVEARLTLRRGGEEMVLTDSRSVSGPIGNLPSEAFAFEVPGAWVSADLRYFLSMHTPAGGGSLGARYPMENDASLGVQDMPAVEIHLVPVRYNADGSGRLPAVDGAALANLRAHFEALLPSAQLILEVTDPIDYNNPIGPLSGGAWSDALRAVQSARQANSPAGHVYYIGLVAPAATASAYCGSGCIAGIGSVNNANQPSQRSSIALGFGRESDFFSAFHELGHTMGFPHAPCGGTSGTDPGYPYAGGLIGVWGRDQRNGSLIPPNASDYMGYCRDKWMSDYNYGRIGTRIIAHGDGGASSIVAAIEHVRIGTGPFESPAFDEGVLEAAASEETGGVLLQSLDSLGTVDGEVWVHHQELSIAGYEQWLVPSDVAGVILPSGRRVMLPAP